MEVIKIKNLHFTYPDDKQALNNIDLTIYKDETVGIIGPNGAGKTTLLLHLIGILKGKGEISILGMEVNNGNLKKIRSKVGLVFQNPDDQLFTSSVFDDVAFGPLNLGFPEKVIKEKVKESLNKVDMNGFEKRTPYHLSFGEKKRIAMATVLSMEPEILVFDEPSYGLDPKSRRELIELIKKMPCTKIIAGHDLEMILELSKKIILINNGVKIVEGETINILNNKEIMEKNELEIPLSLRDRHHGI